MYDWIPESGLVEYKYLYCHPSVRSTTQTTRATLGWVLITVSLMTHDLSHIHLFSLIPDTLLFVNSQVLGYNVISALRDDGFLSLINQTS